ncbi:MAG TPA: serine/threonine protein kinase [Thermoflexia bacterium]|nr:serine/threonine protein kinase [Thermoflexia bacterium]
MPLSAGQVLENRYRIAKLLGQGGFGAVYRAWDTRLSRPCALKENLDASPDAARQFEKEAAILANLHHPNMPRVTDHFSIPGQGQYLVMDFVEGQDLQETLDQRGPLPEAEALPWIVQICDALEYLHSQIPPIIHRDVKPANIKITSQGRPMLVDFGIAKIYDPILRTTAGARAVTPGYSPPEQYGRGHTDNRSDIYALGATLYALLTGQEPADSVESLIGATELTSPRKLNPQISKPVAQAILAAMAPDPVHRYQSADEFKAALGRIPSPRPSRPAVAAARPARPAPAADPSVGAASVPVIQVVRRDKKTKRLAIATLVLGLLSWILGCIHPLAMILLEDPLGLDSGTLILPCIVGVCGGNLSMPAALAMGGLMLTKYRDQAGKGEYVMAIIGMLAAGLMMLAMLAMTIIILIVLMQS